RIWGSTLRPLAGTCNTTRIATSRRGGSSATKVVSAGTPPADAPTATTPVGARTSRSPAVTTASVYPLLTVEEQGQRSNRAEPSHANDDSREDSPGERSAARSWRAARSVRRRRDRGEGRRGGPRPRAG